MDITWTSTELPSLSLRSKHLSYQPPPPLPLPPPYTHYQVCGRCLHTIPYHTIPYHTIPYHTIPYHTIPYHTIPYHTIPYHTVPYRTVPYRTVPYRTVPYHTKYLVRPSPQDISLELESIAKELFLHSVYSNVREVARKLWKDFDKGIHQIFCSIFIVNKPSHQDLEQSTSGGFRRMTTLISSDFLTADTVKLAEFMCQTSKKVSWLHSYTPQTANMAQPRHTAVLRSSDRAGARAVAVIVAVSKAGPNPD